MLKEFLGHISIKFESLWTILAEIEATINNQPLKYTYVDEEGVLYPLLISTWFMEWIWKRQHP